MKNIKHYIYIFGLIAFKKMSVHKSKEKKRKSQFFYWNIFFEDGHKS